MTYPTIQRGDPMPLPPPPDVERGEFATRSTYMVEGPPVPPNQRPKTRQERLRARLDVYREHLEAADPERAALDAELLELFGLLIDTATGLFH